MRFFLFAFPVVIVATIMGFSGCANENPNLVNPPPGLDSIYIRFINFSSDQIPRSLSLENIISTSTVGFGQTSSIIQAPADSMRIIVHNGQHIELSTQTRMRFTRSSFLSIVAVPSDNNALVSRPFDTIIVLNTLAAPLSSDVTTSGVRICNVSKDTNATYSIKLGCQNGEEIARDGGFRSISAYRDIPSGNASMTLVRNKFSTGESEVLGLYSMKLEARKSYTFFVFDDANGGNGLLVLDDRGMGDDALRSLLPITDRTAEIQTYNFTRRDIALQKISNGTGEYLASSLDPLGISLVKQVSACGSLVADQVIALTAAGDTAGRGYFSLEALRKYSVFWFDIPSSDKMTPIILSQKSEVMGDSAMITVINGAFSQNSITVSLGARTNAARQSGYSSGEILCSRLSSGSASTPVAIKSGELPLTVFSTSLPAQLLLSMPAEVQSGKSYYLVLRDNAAALGGIEASLVEDLQVNTSASIMPVGEFVQTINATANSVAFGYDRVLAGALLPQSGAIATILPVGQRTLTIGGVNTNIQTGKDSNAMVFLAGQPQLPDVFIISSPVGACRMGFMRRRYINASSDIAEMTVVFDSASATNVVAEKVAYRASFDEPSLNFERKISIYFIESATKRPLDSMQNVTFPLGRNYSLILTGNAGKYRVITQQEF